MVKIFYQIVGNLLTGFDFKTQISVYCFIIAMCSFSLCLLYTSALMKLLHVLTANLLFCVCVFFFYSSILKCGMKYSNQTWCVHLLFLYLSPLSKACSLLPGKYRNISLYIWRYSWGHSGIWFLGLMCNEPIKSTSSPEVFGNICSLFCNINYFFITLSAAICLQVREQHELMICFYVFK